MVTVPEIRAARALLGWTQPELAKRSGISLRTLKRLELSEAPLTDEYCGALEKVFREAGVELLSAKRSKEGVSRDLD